jgi:hypothetical protein
VLGMPVSSESRQVLGYNFKVPNTLPPLTTSCRQIPQKRQRHVNISGFPPLLLLLLVLLQACRLGGCSALCKDDHHCCVVVLDSKTAFPLRQMQTFSALQLQLQSCRLIAGVVCVALRGPASSAFLRVCPSVRAVDAATCCCCEFANSVCSGQRRSEAWRDGKGGSERRRWCACCMAWRVICMGRYVCV